MATTPLEHTSRALLLAIARCAEEGSHANPGGTAFFVRRDGEEIELGVRALDPDLHPTLELRGFVAPDDWWAFGLVVHGTATFYEEDRCERIVTTYFRSRDGDEVSLLRRGDDVQEMPEGCIGRIPDLLRSVLGSRP
jgi:hypothetical protein